MFAFCRSSRWPGMVRTILCVLEVVLHQRRRADLEAIDQLGRRRREHHHEPVQRIGLDAPDADLLVPLAEREAVDRLAAGDVEDLHLLHPRFDGVEALAVARHAGSPGNAGLERDRADDLFGRLVDDPELLRVGADDQRAIPGRHPRLFALWDAERGRRPARVRGPLRARGSMCCASLRRKAVLSCHGKMRSILRQSFWAAAHLPVQSGA